MRHDPKWAELQRLAVWLEAQPPSKPYNWLDTRMCGIHQYLRAQGRDREYQHLIDNVPGLIGIAIGEPRTMGGMLERTRARLYGPAFERWRESWSPLDKPCHTNVLVELANTSP